MRPKIGSIYYYTSLTHENQQELFLVTSKQNKSDFLYYVMPLASNNGVSWTRINIYTPKRRWKEVQLVELPLYIGMRVHSEAYTNLLRGDDSYASRFILDLHNANDQRPVASHK